MGRWEAKSSLLSFLCSHLQALSCGPRELVAFPTVAGVRAGSPYSASYTTDGIVPAPLPPCCLHGSPIESIIGYKIKTETRDWVIESAQRPSLRRMHFRICFKMKELKTEAWRGWSVPGATQLGIAESRFKSRDLGSLYSVCDCFFHFLDSYFLSYFGGPVSFFFLLLP